MVQRILGGTTRQNLSFEDLKSQQSTILAYTYSFGTLGAILLVFLFIQLFFVVNKLTTSKSKVYSEESTKEERIESGRGRDSDLETPEVHLENVIKGGMDEHGRASSDDSPKKQKRKLIFHNDGSLSHVHSVARHPQQHFGEPEKSGKDDRLKLSPRDVPAQVMLPPLDTSKPKRKMKISMKNGQMSYQSAQE